MACYFPYLTRDQDTVPCGRCPDCRKKHVNGWVYRLLDHSKFYGSPLFITLTYENRYLNITPRGYATLCKRDVQLFFKRLRKAQSTKISYFLAGEYGSDRGRPHYHVILFGSAIEPIFQSWRLGSVDISTEPVTPRALGYTAGYTLKGHRYFMTKFDDRQPEFALMSKGIGFNYLLQEENLRFHRDSMIPYLTLDGGVKVSMPRYYKEFIFNTPDLKDAVKDLAASTSAQKGNAAYIDYIARTGSADGFIDEQNLRRRAATVEFLKQSKKSRKL